MNEKKKNQRLNLEIKSKNIDQGALFIIKRLNDSGYKALAVGGCIRNMIMGEEARDWDITTKATPEEISGVFKEFKVIPVGKKFGTVTVVINYINYDVSTFKKNLIVAHIDVPRVDLKQVPLSEDGTTQLGIMLTHYYGGIRKYQWMSIPLALYGVVIKEDGTRIDISIGDNDGDPVFTFADLLPHLAKDYNNKKISEAIDADKLQLLFGSIPFHDDEIKDNVKLNCLNILHEKYGITEEDLISAEIEIIPAFSSKDVGIDASMVGAYGQDDRVCSYTALRAILDSEEPILPSIVFLADKEEIGSEGNTGARSDFILDFIADIVDFQGYDSSTILRKVLTKTNILSGDVAAAINPSFKDGKELSSIL